MEETRTRLSVSVETLRAELGALELRLVDRINDALDKKADQAVLEQLERRVASLELSRAERQHMPGQLVSFEERLTRLERFRNAVPSAAVLALFLSAAGLVYSFFG